MVTINVSLLLAVLSQRTSKRIPDHCGHITTHQWRTVQSSQLSPHPGDAIHPHHCALRLLPAWFDHPLLWMHPSGSATPPPLLGLREAAAYRRRAVPPNRARPTAARVPKSVCCPAGASGGATMLYGALPGGGHCGEAFSSWRL